MDERTVDANLRKMDSSRVNFVFETLALQTLVMLLVIGLYRALVRDLAHDLWIEFSLLLNIVATIIAEYWGSGHATRTSYFLAFDMKGRTPSDDDVGACIAAARQERISHLKQALLIMVISAVAIALQKPWPVMLPGLVCCAVIG